MVTTTTYQGTRTQGGKSEPHVVLRNTKGQARGICTQELGLKVNPLTLNPIPRVNLGVKG